jgi:MinD-like ATPase involved in chromosome partitioning or flagellar assembly
MAVTRSHVFTFYSYKGGVGRTMALANVAVALAGRGARVLIMDWDLEAPGLDRYFRAQLGNKRQQTPGVVDLVSTYLNGTPIDWRDCTLRVALPGGNSLDLISAGRDDDDYSSRLHSIHWPSAFEHNRLGNYLEDLRAAWLAQYDFILIDSRTGVTDIGGICTINLPDVLVCLFTANNQNFYGISGILARIRLAHSKLQLDRQKLVVLPLPTRDESDSEYEQALTWRAKYSAALADYFADWLPREVTPLNALDRLRIRYVPHWSFGENLPVLEEDPENPKTLAYSFAFVADILYHELDWEKAIGSTQLPSESRRAAVLAEALRYQRSRIEPALVRAKLYIALMDRLRHLSLAFIGLALCFTIASLGLYSLPRVQWTLGSSYLLAFTLANGAILYLFLGLIGRGVAVSEADKLVALTNSNERLQGEMELLSAHMNSERLSPDNVFAEHVRSVEAILSSRPNMDGGTFLDLWRRYRPWKR